MTDRVSRRHFVKTVAVGLGTATVAAQASTPSRWRFFSESEALLVDAIAEQIIPADQDPGAHDAGVVNFIDKQLTTHLRRHRPAYRAGLVGIDETSKVMFEREFVALKAAQQVEVLKALESGKAKGNTWKKQSASGFFNLVREHTMQGFYGGPQHGGNRDYVSYKMLKLDYPQIIGQNRYRRAK